jgi:glycosyltransferase involved in cell wall biosynthesis
MRKRILHVINSLKPGGAETLLANSLSAGGLQEHTDNFVAYFQGTSQLESRIDKEVDIYDLGYKGVLSLPRTLLKLRSIIKEKQVDIVHSHLTPAGFYTHLVCPVPQVHTLHTTYSMDKENDPRKLYLEKHLFYTKRSCNIILLSDFQKEDFLRSVTFKGSAFVLNNFVPGAYFKDNFKTYERRGGSLRMLAIGRLSEVKNFGYLIQVFTLLKNYNIQLDIYGGGDVEGYRGMAAEAGVKVNIMGYGSDLSGKMQEYDLFIMPSKFEGFPLSLFEAMASGIPVMLSDISPLRELAKEHALYFPLNDAACVANSLIEIFNGNTDINLLAKTGQQYAGEIARREKYINKLLTIYDTITDPENSKG